MSSATPKPLVHVVDDEVEVRKVLRSVLANAGYEADTYESAGEFLDRCDRTRPGCILLDIRLKGTSGLELLEQLQATGCMLPVVIISGHADVPIAVRALKGGAMDLLEKPFDNEVLLDRVRKALQRDARLRKEQEDKAAVMTHVAQLTAREREVMHLVVDGHPNKRIASELGISIKTVEAHRAHVMRKMQAESLAELVRLAESIAPRSDPAAATAASDLAPRAVASPGDVTVSDDI